MPRKRFIIGPEGAKEIPIEDEAERQKMRWEKELSEVMERMKDPHGLSVEEQNQLWKKQRELEKRLGLGEGEREPPTGLYV